MASASVDNHARFMRIGRSITLGLIALVCVALVLARKWLQVDQTSAMLLALAIVALVIDQVTRFEGFGVTIEKKIREEVQQQTADLREEFKSDVNDMDRAITAIEKTVGPTATPAVRSAAAATAPAADDEEDIWDLDPHKDKFGGSPTANDRELSARVWPAAGPRSAKCHVKIKVRSTNPARPLAGEVEIYLHPTYGKWEKYKLNVVDGIATDEFDSWGVFTVGAVADRGETKLELDLATVEGGTVKFYSQ